MTWVGDAATGYLRMIDQTLLPVEFREIDCRTVEDIWEAIRSLRVRGAPAIGVAAAYGMVVGLQSVRECNRKECDRRVTDGPCERPSGDPRATLG